MKTATVTQADELAEAMREAMTTIREWEDGVGSAGKAHHILYEALKKQDRPVYEEGL